MAIYDSTRTGSAHDSDHTRITALENQNIANRLTTLENTDESYLTRISTLENQIILQNNTITTLTNRIATLENSLVPQNKTSLLTNISSKVKEKYFYISGRTAYLFIWLDTGTPDQHTCGYVPNQYKPINGMSTLACFNMNYDDASKVPMGYMSGTRIEFRCINSPTVGTSGILMQGTWLF